MGDLEAAQIPGASIVQREPLFVKSEAAALERATCHNGGDYQRYWTSQVMLFLHSVGCTRLPRGVLPFCKTYLLHVVPAHEISYGWFQGQPIKHAVYEHLTQPRDQRIE